MPEKPLVSVVMPVFNGEDFVEEAIASILAQTLFDFEFIIVDDASTDGTPEILAKIRDPRVSVIRNSENLESAASLNRAIDMAAGKFIAIMNADDICLPQRLALQVEFLQARSALAGCGTFVETLRAKVGLVALAMVLSAVHDFVLGPKVTTLAEGATPGGAPSPELIKARRKLIMLARANVAVILAVLVVAVMLGRGWPF